ncbi:MAG: hypothetical protein LBN97_05685, partial [Oscillospiraceae bacterium]|nr:hypothetical protein [Oscillospiraceae bacterium]
FDKRYNALAERYEKANARLDEISAYRADKAYRERQMSAFLLELQKLPEVLTDYDDHLWHMLLDRATVCADGAVQFTFRDGNTITIAN